MGVIIDHGPIVEVIEVDGGVRGDVGPADEIEVPQHGVFGGGGDERAVGSIGLSGAVAVIDLEDGGNIAGMLQGHTHGHGVGDGNAIEGIMAIRRLADGLP